MTGASKGLLGIRFRSRSRPSRDRRQGRTVACTARNDFRALTETILDAPGSAVDLDKGVCVRYELENAATTVVVFAEEPYSPAPTGKEA